MHRRTFTLGALCALATPATAAARRYGIGPGGAEIVYAFTMNGAKAKGTVPLSNANLRIDPNNLAASTADVTADIRKARTGFVFATEALKSKSVLDAQGFPQSRFTSTRVILGPGGSISQGAAIEGRLTLRGVTRPIRLNAALYRPRGSGPEDLSRLSVNLTGTLRRSAFGASGYADIVADTVGLTIRADIIAR